MAREYSHQKHAQLRFMDLSREKQEELRAAGLLRVYGMILVDLSDSGDKVHGEGAGDSGFRGMEQDSHAESDSESDSSSESETKSLDFSPNINADENNDVHTSTTLTDTACPELCIVTIMERAPPDYVPLRDVMKSGLTFLDTKILLLRLIECVKKLHSYEFLHLDLKPDNFLCKVITKSKETTVVTKSNGTVTGSITTHEAVYDVDFHLLLVDYDGFCTVTQFQRYASARKVPATDLYTPPERLAYRPDLHTPAEIQLGRDQESLLKHPINKSDNPGGLFLPDCEAETLLHLEYWSIGIIALELFFDWEFLQEIGTNKCAGGGGLLQQITRGNAGSAWAHDRPYPEEWRKGKLDQLKFGRERWWGLRRNAGRGNPVLTDPQRDMDLIVRTGVARLRYRILEAVGEGVDGGMQENYVDSRSEVKVPGGGDVNDIEAAVAESGDLFLSKSQTDGKWTRYLGKSLVGIRAPTQTLRVADDILRGLDEMLIGMLQINPRFRRLPEFTSDSFLSRHTDPGFRVQTIRENVVFSIQQEKLLELPRTQRAWRDAYNRHVSCITNEKYAAADTEMSTVSDLRTPSEFYESQRTLMEGSDAIVGHKKYAVLCEQQKTSMRSQIANRIGKSESQNKAQNYNDDGDSDDKTLRVLCYILLTSGDPCSGRGFGGLLSSYHLLSSYSKEKELSVPSPFCRTDDIKALVTQAQDVVDLSDKEVMPLPNFTMPRDKFPADLVNSFVPPGKSDMASLVLAGCFFRPKTGPQMEIGCGPPTVGRCSRMPNSFVSLSGSTEPDSDSASQFLVDLANPELKKFLCYNATLSRDSPMIDARCIRKYVRSLMSDSTECRLLDKGFDTQNIGTVAVEGLGNRQRSTYWGMLEKYWREAAALGFGSLNNGNINSERSIIDNSSVYKVSDLSLSQWQKSFELGSRLVGGESIGTDHRYVRGGLPYPKGLDEFRGPSHMFRELMRKAKIDSQVGNKTGFRGGGPSKEVKISVDERLEFDYLM